METVSSCFKNKYEIWIYIILIISSTLAALLVVHNIKISPDSMRFGLVSQQILSGNGIRVPIIRLEDSYVPVNGAIPFLDQMPLLSVLFAVMGGITPQNFLPAQILNLICHVVISIFTFLLMKNLCNKGIALLTGILVSFSYPLLRVTHHIWSEPLFITFTLASIYFLTLSRNSHGFQFSRNLFAATICASAAILTRNAGITLVAIFLWEVFILVKNKRPESKYVSTIVAITIPIIITVSMFVRSYIISGSLRGYHQASPERSYLSAFTGTIEMIFQQFQLGKNAVILIILFMLFFIVCFIINTKLRIEILKYFSSGLDIIIVFIMSYTTLMVVAMAKQAWNFELRLVSPLVPFLFISGIFITVFVWDRIKFERFSKLSLVGMILSLSIIALGNSYKTFLNLYEFFYKQEKAYSILHSCTYKWLKENYKGNIMITSNKPFHLSFFGGYSTVALPHKRFDPKIHVPDDMKSVLPNRMSWFGSRVLALFDEVEERYEGSYITRLFNNRKDTEKFSIAYECSDGVVYNLKE
jgi:hypothetical protein